MLTRIRQGDVLRVNVLENTLLTRHVLNEKCVVCADWAQARSHDPMWPKVAGTDDDRNPGTRIDGLYGWYTSTTCKIIGS